MITVYMAGLIYHHGCATDAKRALVPDGTGYCPRHYASLFIEPDRVIASDWWKGCKIDHSRQVKVIEFRIPTRAEITFPDDDNQVAQFVNLNDWLPKPETYDKKFEIDLDYPETIAEAPIRGGALTAYSFRRELDKEDVAIVQWAIKNDSSEVTINARSLHDHKTLTLKNRNDGYGLEIVFSNTQYLISEPKHPKHKMTKGHEMPSGDMPGHFMLYEKLNKHRPGEMKDNPHGTTGLKPLKYSHAYLKYLAGKLHPFLGDPGCTPTCC
jgi:hypothetical protein